MCYRTKSVKLGLSVDEKAEQHKEDGERAKARDQHGRFGNKKKKNKGGMEGEGGGRGAGTGSSRSKDTMSRMTFF